MSENTYPAGWQMDQTWEAKDNLMQIERFDKRLQKKVVTDYLIVPNRLFWFIRDQRALIMTGHATTSYAIQTEMVEHDTEKQWAHFKTYVRDVLGNEATMYGSESVKDFSDYIEKASTKSLGRALLLLGYGTQFASSDLEEDARPVDSPAARKRQNAPSNIRAINPAQEAMVPIGKVRNALRKGGHTEIPEQNAFLATLSISIAEEYTQATYERIVNAVRG